MTLTLSAGRFGLACWALGMLAATAPSGAVAQPVDALEFFAYEGCAIGPATRSAALEAGIKEKAIDALFEAGRADAQSVVTGDWLVLGPDMCQIRPSIYNGALAITDPEVQAAISAEDAYAEFKEWGCFLSSDILFEELRQSRNWDDDTINREYLRMLGAAVAEGHFAFYSDSPLRTPVGYQLTTGECATGPQMTQIRESHAFLLEHFDTLIRANAANIPCSYGADPITLELWDLADTLAGGERPNAWIGLDIMVIAMGAGWYEDISMTEKGTPRPPLCHFE